MAKSVIEQLKAMCTPEEWAVVQAKIDANPVLAVNDRKMSELFSAYLGEEEPVPVVAAAAAAAEPAVLATVKPAVLATVTGDSSAILAKLTELSTNLDTRFEELDTKFVPVAKLGEYRNDMLASSIRAADDYAQVRESHRAEFGEPLKRDDFEKFVMDQKTAGVGYKDMAAAHDSFVFEKRNAKKIADGIAEGVKVKTSGTNVPGSTQTVGLSPAQQVIAKAKAAAVGTGDGKSNAMAAADRLAQLRRQREDGQAVQ